jgi:hypothetical protein
MSELYRLVSASVAPFNYNLYVVGATVIPVLFIALMLPPGLLARYALLVKEHRNAQLRQLIQGDKATGKVSGRSLWAVFRRYDIVVLPAALAFVFFVWGEISAVYALDHRHATATEHTGVMWSLIGLPILTVLSVVGALAFDRKAILGSDEGSPMAPVESNRSPP